MSFASNREQYLTLMHLFVSRRISGNEFEQQFADLWRADRDEQYADLRRSGAHLSPTPLPPGHALNQVLDSVFTACDVFNPDETAKEDYEYSENQLRTFVGNALLELEQSAQQD